MKFQTKHKKLEENFFADMVVLVGRYMEYGNMHSKINREEFIKYYKQKDTNIVARCIVQKNVIEQAKRFYEKMGISENITYGKVRRVFRRNMFVSIRIRTEQYYFWKFVMDYIIENDELLNIMLKELMIECKFYTSNVNEKIPVNDCLQQILGWYYVRIIMNHRIFLFDKKKREKMISLFCSYEQFSKFKSSCRLYIANR